MSLYTIDEKSMSWECSVPATHDQIRAAMQLIKEGGDPVLWIPDSKSKFTITSCRRATKREIREAFKAISNTQKKGGRYRGGR